MTSIDNLDLHSGHDSKKKIAKPPLNILFNSSLVNRKDIWDIDIGMLLKMLLQILNETGKKDLRLCGVAALSSSMIHRLKVESIFRLDKIATQRKIDLIRESDVPIADLNTIELPFRLESTYPISLNDLIQMMENMIFELSSPDYGKRKLNLEPVQAAEIEEYSHQLEQIILEYQETILDKILSSGEIMFKLLVLGLEQIEIARYFIALLYLATEEKISLQDCEECEDIKIMTKRERMKSDKFLKPPPER